MKNSLRYLKLWQKKRNELQINDDQQSDWLEMQSVLDKHLPVNTEGNEGSSRSKGFKLLSLLLISLSAAAITYVVSTKIIIKNQDHKTHSYKVKTHIALNTDPSYRDSIADSLTANSAGLNNKDSLLLNEPRLALKNVTAANTVFSNKAGSTASHHDPSGEQSALIKNKSNNRSSQNGQNKNPTGIGGNSQNRSLLASVTGGRAISSPMSTSPSGKGRSFNKNGYPSKYQAGSSNNETYHNNNNRNSSSTAVKDAQNNGTDLLVLSPKANVGSGRNYFNAIRASVLSVKTIQSPLVNKQAGNKTPDGKEKSVKVKGSTSTNLNIDWGVLTGVNSSGSFTAKSRNSNFYGSSPVDLYFGLYATYNIDDKWGINSQVRLFSPQTVTTVYTHANQSKIDSGQSLQITSSRKIYSINIPLHAVYKVNNNLSFMAGPVINIPVKQTNANTILQPDAIKSDSVYYPKVLATLNGTKYEQKLNFGLSGGVNIQIKRFSIAATYMKSLSGYQVSSDFGSYKSYNGTFQFTIGFQLNKLKP